MPASCSLRERRESGRGARVPARVSRRQTPGASQLALRTRWRGGMRARHWWVLAAAAAAATMCRVRGDEAGGQHVLAPGRALERQTIAPGLRSRPPRACPCPARCAHAPPAVTRVRARPQAKRACIGWRPCSPVPCTRSRSRGQPRCDACARVRAFSPAGCAMRRTHKPVDHADRPGAA